MGRIREKSQYLNMRADLHEEFKTQLTVPQRHKQVLREKKELKLTNKVTVAAAAVYIDLKHICL